MGDMMERLVGLHGAAESGKDTVADYLGKMYEYQKFSFASHLKDIAALAFDLDRSRMDDQDYKQSYDERYKLTVREILQKLGTESFRYVFDEDFWLNAVGLKIDKAIRPLEVNRFVISDVRFSNEALWIQSQGGVVVDINRVQDTKVPQHASESGIDPQLINFTLDNNGSLNHLYCNIETMVATW